MRRRFRLFTPNGVVFRALQPLLPWVVGVLMCCEPASAQVGNMRQTVPHDAYFGVHDLLYDGDYVDALAGFQECVRSSIKTPTSYWIDSICYHSMCGETYFQMGQYGPALEHFNKSLQLFVNFNDWMIPVRFSPAVSASRVTFPPIPWGRSQRQFVVGHFPDTVSIRQGRIDNSAVVVNGGVVQQAIDFPINPQEIVWCTCWTLRRRRDLLGPIAPHDALTQQAIAALTKRPVQPGHWSEGWLDAELGCAFAAAGNDAQAKPVLEKSLVVGGQFDHPMTSLALLELGRIAMNAADWDAATRYFEEATYSAYYFDEPLVVEEGLAYAAITHFLANRPGAYLPVAAASEWARREGNRHLWAHLAALVAEGQCLLDQAGAAQAVLDAARPATVQNTIVKGRVGAQLNFVQALTSYQSGHVVAGDAAISAALGFAENGSLKLFHLALAEMMTIDRSLSGRVAKDVFAQLLRDPLPSDWLNDPLETLAKLVFPYPLYYERWFELSLEAKELDGKRALEISELAKRHKFLSAQEFGGRLINLRWVLEGPLDGLPPSAVTQRQTILATFPGYEKLSQRSQLLQAQLLQRPLLPDDPAAAKEQAEKLAELEFVCKSQEVMLKAIALRRLPVDLVFPPARSVDDVQKSLPSGTGVLSYYVGQRGAYGFLLNREKFGYWPIAAADTGKKVVTLLQSLGNFDENKQMRGVDLRSNAWHKPAAELFELLTKESHADLPYGFDELVIVPDAALWYVPFETLLTTPRGDAPRPLLERARLRYSPTVGLAVGDKRPRLLKGKSLVSLGKLYPTDSDEVGERTFEEYSRALPGAEKIGQRTKLGVGGATFAALADRYVALFDLQPPPGAVAPSSLLSNDRTAQGGGAGDWLRLPWRGPEQVALPGFHSGAENSLKKMNAADAGNDLFFTTTALVGSGARTVLISRWRPGGRTATDLVREFMQELPYAAASRSWQRAVVLAQQSPIAPELEPRVQWENDLPPPPPTHPFFWAAYLVLDTGSEPETAVK